MATMTPGDTKQDERRRIEFSLAGKRKSIRFHAMSFGEGVRVKQRIEELVDCLESDRDPKLETEKWLLELKDKLHERIAATGLVAARQTILLGDFLNDYIVGRVDVAESTLRKWEAPRKSLIEFFKPDKKLRDITRGDAEDWRRSLTIRRGKHKGKPIAENTRRGRSAVARLFFEAAVKKNLIAANPFDDLPRRVGSNPARQRFIDRHLAEAVLEACPNTQWKLIFALNRYGGLRCPSEVLNLKWNDFNWEKNKFLVECVKTAHHVGKEFRFVPIFPELLPYLLDAQELAEEGAEYVITAYRKRNSNLSTQFKRILRRAGIKAWPKLFQNLRSTRQTELVNEGFPSHVVCAWLGNSEEVAKNHYYQVTDEHFERAANPSGVNFGVNHSKNEPIEQDSKSTPTGKPPCFPAYANLCTDGMTPAGLEPALPA